MNVENSSEVKHKPTMEPPPSYSGPLPQTTSFGPPAISSISVYPGEMTTEVISTQPVSQPVLLARPLGHDPVVMKCSFCNQQIATRIERVVWFGTHFAAASLCLVLCWPCVIIPYYTNICKKAVHYCPSCNSYLGTQSSLV